MQSSNLLLSHPSLGGPEGKYWKIGIEQEREISVVTLLGFVYKFQVGWSASFNQGFGEAPGIKKQVLDIIRSVRTVMRIPLIFINSLVIVKKLVLG